VTNRDELATQAGPEPDPDATPAAATTAAAVTPDPSVPDFHGGAIANLKQFVVVLRRGDDASLEQAVVQLSKVHRWLAPVALIAGAVLMLFQGLKLLFANWRLTLVQVLPAMWIWVAMIDVKAHILHGKSFHVLRGPVLIPVILAIAAITAASFFLNAVFAFAITRHKGEEIRPAFAEARVHLKVILAWGLGIGLCLGFATMITSRWGHWPFAIAMSIVIAIMMVTYLAVPARLIGISPQAKLSRKDKLTAAAIGGALGAVVCSPPYFLGRVGILMLGIHYLFIPGLILLIVGLTLQAGATSAVKSIKMSAKLVSGSSSGAVVQPAETSS
jgi:hypothetical protein